MERGTEFLRRNFCVEIISFLGGFFALSTRCFGKGPEHDAREGDPKSATRGRSHKNGWMVEGIRGLGSATIITIYTLKGACTVMYALKGLACLAVIC